MDRWIELPEPRKGRLSSNHDERRIIFLRYEDELVPAGDLQFGVFRKKGQQLKCVGKESTRTPGTIHEIPSRVLIHLEKLTSRKPSILAEAVDMIDPAHANALRTAGRSPPFFPTMRELWGNRMRRWRK